MRSSLLAASCTRILEVMCRPSSQRLFAEAQAAPVAAFSFPPPLDKPHIPCAALRPPAPVATLS